MTTALDKLSSEAYHAGIQDELIEFDPQVHTLITDEYQRLEDTIQLLAAENRCSRAVLAHLAQFFKTKPVKDSRRPGCTAAAA